MPSQRAGTLADRASELASGSLALHDRLLRKVLVSVPMIPRFRLPGQLFSLVALTACCGAAAETLPAWILELPEELETVLVADTSSATLYEYTFDVDGNFEVTEHYMSIGSNGVEKVRAGDQKTPLGNYFIVDQLDTSRLDPKYGITAFPMDYPNTLDRIAGKTGSGIWLHGVLPGNERRPRLDTDGCIALPNENLAKLAARLKPNETPVIVTREMQFAEPAESEAVTIALRKTLERWRRAMQGGDAIAYLSSYAPEFRYRGLDREEWAAMRAAELAAAPPVDFEIKDLLILQDPETPQLYLTRFRATRKTGNGTTVVQKRLYWRKASDGRFLVIAEDNG